MNTDLNLFVPSSVVFLANRQDFGIPSGAVYPVSVSLASLALPAYAGVVGYPGSKVFRSTAAATFTGGGSPTNAAALLALATQLASDWYGWQLGRLDLKLIGPVALVAEGFHDLEFTHQLGDGAQPEISTRVTRQPFLEHAEEVFHFGAREVVSPLFAYVSASDGGTPPSYTWTEVVPSFLENFLAPTNPPPTLSGGPGSAPLWEANGVSVQTPFYAKIYPVADGSFLFFAGSGNEEVCGPVFWCSETRNLPPDGFGNINDIASVSKPTLIITTQTMAAPVAGVDANITGVVPLIGPDGTSEGEILEIRNGNPSMGGFLFLEDFSFAGLSGSSSAAANSFEFFAQLVSIAPGYSQFLRYNSVTSRWNLTDEAPLTVVNDAPDHDEISEPWQTCDLLTVKRLPLSSTPGLLGHPVGLKVNHTGTLGETKLQLVLPLSVKGDLFTWDTGNVRLPAGMDGYVLTASSAAATGLVWAPQTGGTALTVDYFLGASPIFPTTELQFDPGWFVLSGATPTAMVTIVPDPYNQIVNVAIGPAIQAYINFISVTGPPTYIPAFAGAIVCGVGAFYQWNGSSWETYLPGSGGSSITAQGLGDTVVPLFTMTELDIDQATGLVLTQSGSIGTVGCVPATPTHQGAVSITTQAFKGIKTFEDDVLVQPTGNATLDPVGTDISPGAIIVSDDVEPTLTLTLDQSVTYTGSALFNVNADAFPPSVDQVGVAFTENVNGNTSAYVLMRDWGSNLCRFYLATDGAYATYGPSPCYSIKVAPTSWVDGQWYAANTILDILTVSGGIVTDKTTLSQPTITGAKLPADTVMADLLTALAGLGLLTDSTT